MNMTRIIAVVVALIAAVGAAILAFNLTGTPDREVVIKDKVERERILIATTDISVGEKISLVNTSWEDWPSELLQPWMITEASQPDALDKLVGTYVRSSLASREPIKESKLIRSDSGFMSVVLPSGKRAISVPINYSSGVSGFIFPNDRVDVILTNTSDRNDSRNSRYFTETLLTNVRILAINQNVDSATKKDGENKDQKAIDLNNNATATLELGPKEAEVLAKSQQLGILTLVLRSVEDINEEPGEANKLNSGRTGVKIVKYGVRIN